MSTDAIDKPNEAFRWECQPVAAAVVQTLVEEFCRRSSAARQLKDRLKHETGTRLLDWIDHVAPADSQVDRAALGEIGFVQQDFDGTLVAEHPGGMFPTIRLDSDVFRLGVKVESVGTFLAVNRIADATLVGAPWGPLRMARIAAEADTELWIVERHGYRGFEASDPSAAEVATLLDHQEALRNRRRRFERDEKAFEHALTLIAAATNDLGVDRTCDLFFAAEREYWLSRNRAGRFQRARQDRLGLGWGNHDHHTYRSSRECFHRLIRVLESLGLVCRERFYAGEEAGWGAQVLEQPECRLMVFADVDLSPDEVAGDFAHNELEPRDTLGTVGLWCRLHGEAMLQAGMHHLEAQFDFEAAREQLAREGIASMAPFTDFPFLRQAFTQGEMWPVEPSRLARALVDGHITDRLAEQFVDHGALGSHLEILERNDGYKGFNQSGISHIIRRTDPRGA